MNAEEDKEPNSWSLSQADIKQYQQHVQSRIGEDLQDSMTHLTDHGARLADLVDNLIIAKQQVVNTVGNSREKILEECSTLLTSVTTAINNRQQELLDQLLQIEDEALRPLTECEAVLNGAVQQTQTLLDQGLALADSASATRTNMGTKDYIIKFQKEAALNNCLPSVPELCSVACVSIAFPDGVEESVLPILHTYGTLRRMAPVQITHTEEKPGAVLVCWEEVDEEDDEAREYVLQCSTADEPDQRGGAYTTVYRGEEDRYLLQKLTPGCAYWLRVSHAVSATPDTVGGACQPSWSLPRRCTTSLPCYTWRCCDGWRVADGGQLACKEGDDSAIVTSTVAQLAGDCTLTMQVVCGGGGCSDEGLALSWQPLLAPQDCMAPGALFLSATGSVVVDGELRLMKLPPLSTDTCVSFTVERQPHRRDKIRVHIDTHDKQVTYEWAVPSSHSKNPHLYFSASFAQPHWAIRVY